MILTNCPLCSSQKIESVYKRDEMFFTDGRTSIDLDVCLCEGCGFVFQSSAYGEAYDAKAASLYDNYRMSDNFDFPRRDKKSIESLEFICANIGLNATSDILEIGSDRDDFLFMLKERFGSNVVGIEPNSQQVAYVPTVKGCFDKDSFSSKFNLIVLKHTLEHIKYPKAFLEDVFASIRDDGYLYIEVPSFDVCKKYYLEDFAAEHVSYFSKASLLGMLRGHEIVAVDDSHFLRVIARKAASMVTSTVVDIDMEATKRFFKEFSSRLTALEEKIIKHANAGGAVVFYGVGLYFRAMFGRLDGRIEKQNCYFYDDGFSDESEGSFGLKKADINSLAEQKVLAVWCSNDFKVQDSMNERFGLLMKEYEPIYFCRTNSTRAEGQ